MKSEILSQEQNVVVIRAEHDAEAFRSAVNAVVRELSRHMRIPGFRPGKAPRRVVEMRVGRDALYKEALEEIVPKTLEQLVEEYDLKPIKDPTIKLETAEEGKPLVVEATFDVRPEVELPPDLSQIRVIRPNTDPTEEQIAQEIERIRASKSEEKPVADRAAAEGDVVLALYDSFLIGEDGSESPLEREQRGRIDLKAENLREAIRSALVGRNVGDSAEAVVDVEEDYRESKIAGRRVRYAMKVEGILETWMPPLEEEQIPLLSDGKAKTLEEFRALVSERVRAWNEYAADDVVSQRATDALMKGARVDLPDRLVEEEVRARREADEKKAREAGKAFSEWLKEAGFDTVEAYEAAQREDSRKALAVEFALEVLGEQEGIRVDSRDYDRELTRASWMYRIPKAEMMKKAEQSSHLAHRLVDQALRRKTLRLLVDRVTVVPEGEAEASRDPREGVSPVVSEA